MKLTHTIQISVWSKDDKPRRGDHCGSAHNGVPEDISAEDLQALLAKMVEEADADLVRGLKFHPEYPLLGEIIKTLAAHHLPVYGVHHPSGEQVSLSLSGDSSRANYAEYAIRPVDGENAPIVYSDDLAAFLKEEIQYTMTGWKGGEYSISENTFLHIGDRGDRGHVVQGVEVTIFDGPDARPEWNRIEFWLGD